MATEEEKRHARLMNITDVVPSLTGTHYKVHPPKKAKSEALKKVVKRLGGPEFEKHKSRQRGQPYKKNEKGEMEYIHK